MKKLILLLIFVAQAKAVTVDFFFSGQNGFFSLDANTVELIGTGNTTATFPSTSSILARTDAGQSFVGSDVFSLLGVGGATSSSNVDAGCIVYHTRTTAPATTTVGLLQHNYYAMTPVDADTLGAGHSIGFIARCSDTSSDVGAQFSGAEFKRQAFGASDSGSAAWCDSLYNMSSASGRFATGLMSTAEFFNGTPSTPITTGGFVALHAQTPGFGTTEGDSTKFWSLIGDTKFQLQTGGIIASYSGATPTYGSLAAAYIGMQHNGTDGFLTTSSGNLQLAGAGGFVIAETGQSLVPLTTGGALGISSNRWALTATTGSFNGTLTTTSGRLDQLNVITGTTTLDGTYFIVVCNSGSAFTVTLPSAPTTNQHYYVMNKGAGAVTLAGNGKNIDGVANQTINQNSCNEIVYDGAQWDIL
jgi:hypothetical protein